MKREGFAGLLYTIFRKDIGRKAMALLFAVILWIQLADSLVTEKIYRLPIRVVNGEEAFWEESGNIELGYFFVIPPDLMEAGKRSDKNLEVSLYGPKELMPERLIGRKDITMSDMDNRQRYKVTGVVIREFFEQLMGKDRIGVKGFKPERITLVLAERDSEPIVLNWGHVKEFVGLNKLQDEGRDIDDVDFDPDTIVIEGPAEEIEKIRADPTLFKLAGMKLSGTARTKIDGYLGLSREMQEKRISISNNQRVLVTVSFTEEQGEFLLEGLPVGIKFEGEFLPSDYLARIALDSELSDPRKVNVRFKGPITEIDTLKRKDRTKLRGRITPYINFEEGLDRTGDPGLDKLIKNMVKRTTVMINLTVDWGVFDSARIELVVEPHKIVVKRAEQEDSE